MRLSHIRCSIQPHCLRNHFSRQMMSSAFTLAARKRLRSASDCIIFSPLMSISSCPDLWERICDQCNGDTLITLAAMPEFSDATTASRAWYFLSGLDDDANLVPWSDANNVLSKCFCISSQVAPFDKLLCPVFPRQVRCEHHGPARPSTPCCGHMNPSAQLADANRPPLLDLLSPRVFVCDCSASPSDRPVQPPAFGIRPGFTCAPYWDVLTGDICDCDD